MLTPWPSPIYFAGLSPWVRSARIPPRKTVSRTKNRLSVGWTDGSAIGGPFYEKSTHGPNCWTLREPHPRFGGFSSTKSFFRRA